MSTFRDISDLCKWPSSKSTLYECTLDPLALIDFSAVMSFISESRSPLEVSLVFQVLSLITNELYIFDLLHLFLEINWNLELVPIIISHRLNLALFSCFWWILLYFCVFIFYNTLQTDVDIWFPADIALNILRMMPSWMHIGFTVAFSHWEDLLLCTVTAPLSIILLILPSSGHFQFVEWKLHSFFQDWGITAC